MDLMKAFTEKYKKAEPPKMNIGDTVRVHLRVKEGSRERIQVFEGTVIAKKHGGIEESFTVRRISYGIGVVRRLPELIWWKSRRMQIPLYAALLSTVNFCIN